MTVGRDEVIELSVDDVMSAAVEQAACDDFGPADFIARTHRVVRVGQ